MLARSFPRLLLAALTCAALTVLPSHAVVVSGTGAFANPSAAVAVSGTPVYGIDHDGVAELLVTIGGNNFRSSSALLWTGQHVLTAAHSVDNGVDGGVGISSGTINFTYGVGANTLNIPILPGMVTIHPLWNGSVGDGYDVAIITLDDIVDPFVPRYNIFEGDSSTIFGQAFTMIGYGRTGTGATGDTIGSGTKRFGRNEYENDLGETTIIFSDFDNGLAAQNALDLAGTSSLGLGDEEADTAGGDSGGPNFIEDPDNPGQYLIAGITSFSARFGSPPDINGVTDDTFGELKGDSDVGALSGWINSVVIPEPATGSLLLGAGLIALLRRRK